VRRRRRGPAVERRNGGFRPLRPGRRAGPHRERIESMFETG